MSTKCLHCKVETCGRTPVLRALVSGCASDWSVELTPSWAVWPHRMTPPAWPWPQLQPPGTGCRVWTGGPPAVIKANFGNLRVEVFDGRYCTDNNDPRQWTDNGVSRKVTQHHANTVQIILGPPEACMTVPSRGFRDVAVVTQDATLLYFNPKTSSALARLFCTCEASALGWN